MRVSGGTGFSVYNEQFASIVKYNIIVVSRISLLHGQGERQIFASSQATSQGVSLPAPWWGLVRVDASCKILTPPMGKKCEKLQAERLCCIDLVKQMLGQPSPLPAAHPAEYTGSRTVKVDPCPT